MFKALQRFFQVSLYEINNSAIGPLYLTNHKHAITAGGKKYAPWPIKHGKFYQSMEKGKMHLSVNMKQHPDLLAIHIHNVPKSATTIKVYHHAPEESGTDALLVFSGLLNSAKIKGAEMRLEFVHDLIGGNRENNVQSVSVMCPLSLYSNECGAGVTPDTYSVGAISNGGKTITLSPAPTVAGDHYVYGYLQANGVRRGVINQSGADITIIAPIPGLVVGNTVQVAAGCDKRIATCQAKFNNVENFGGFKFIPLNDPMNDGGRIA